SFKAVTNQKAAIIEDYSKMKIGTKVVIANGIYGEIVNLGKTTADVVVDKSKSVIINVSRSSLSSV
ncbi:preprotein translocase subunit YajC, partial [Clostridium sp.]|uniref:preprotein translocase subunit YajC n=1 Tax=Clostridium sp. TaxID=1506 RepID=UPI003F3677C4